MEDVIKVSGNHYVLATSAPGAEQNRIVKQSHTFAVFDSLGDIRSVVFNNQGIFHNGTRYVSGYQFLIEGKRPLLLSSDVTRDNHLITVDLTNPDLILSPIEQIPRGTVHVFRSKFLWEGRCYEKYRIRNFGLDRLSVRMTLKFSCDFDDIFEVRGMKRSRKGEFRETVAGTHIIEFPYLGLDGILRTTRVEFSQSPDSLQGDEAAFNVLLDTNEEMEFEIVISCLSEGDEYIGPVLSYIDAYASSSRFFRMARGRECSIRTSNDFFNTVMERAVSDLRMLLTDEGRNVMYPHAGIPWFSTPFGRDGLITAMETLWFNPDISRGVLEYLANNQAKSFNDIQDSEPGKILHEIRMGEMTNTQELPFARYYGSADSTPLFVMLAGRYLQRTGDIGFIETIWPHIKRAIDWINIYGDVDGDGFVEYKKKAEFGIRNQAWKDSPDSVFHADGSLAEPPIAICEVQAYIFNAKRQAAFIAQHLGFQQIAFELLTQAKELQRNFEHIFWDDDLPGYVLALDRDKKPCRVRASNMGHCLFSGISSNARARVVAESLMDESFFSEWGVRTLAKGQPRYNPMSYHNGSIWPHDNAMIAEGFSRYGFKEQAGRIMNALFHMSQFTELNRFPELFCGFERRLNQGPTLYPVACAPQAWAAGSIFSLLQSCLGLTIQSINRQITFTQPYLPDALKSVFIRNLPVGDAVVDFAAEQHEDNVIIKVLKRTGDVSVIVSK